MSDENKPAEMDGQLAFDEADSAAGYRSVIDRQEAAQLPADNPNIASGHGDYNHEDHIGEPLDDDLGVGAAGALIDAGEVS